MFANQSRRDAAKSIASILKMINSSQLNTPSQINSLLLIMETELMATTSMFIYVSFYWIDVPLATQKASIRTSVRTSTSAILARQIVIPRIRRAWTQSGRSDVWTFSSTSAPATARTASDIKPGLTSASVGFSLFSFSHSAVFISFAVYLFFSFSAFFLAQTNQWFNFARHQWMLRGNGWL